MSTQIKDSIPTVQEYYDLIANPNPSPVDLTKIRIYEDYMTMCRELDEKGLLPESAQKIVTEDRLHTMDLGTKENKTDHEEKVLSNFQSTFDNQNMGKENDGPVRQLTKAGYIDATVILVVILNVGFIIAMALLGR